MQMLNVYFGGNLRLECHAARNINCVSRHYSLDMKTDVNSYHGWDSTRRSADRLQNRTIATETSKRLTVRKIVY